MFVTGAVVLVVRRGTGSHDASHCVEWEQVSTCFWGVAWFDWSIVEDALILGFAILFILNVLASLNSSFRFAELEFVSASSWFGILLDSFRVPLAWTEIKCIVKALSLILDLST